MNNQTIFYGALYAFTVIVTFLGVFFHLIPGEMLVASLFVVIGHGAGLFQFPPDTGSKDGAKNG